MAKNFIDMETGKTIENVVYIRTQDQQNYIDSLKKNKSTGKHYVQLYMEEVKKVSEINLKVLGAFLLLTTYLKFKDNVLPFAKINEFQDIFGVEEKQTKRYIKELKDKGLLIKEGSKFSMPINIVNKGATQNKEFVRCFQQIIQDLSKSIKLEDLGFLLTIIPYIHYNKNIICHNPFESNLDLIKPMNVSELSVVLGISRPTLYTKIENLRGTFPDIKKELRILIKAEHGIIVNPLVLNRNTFVGDELLDLFIVLS